MFFCGIQCFKIEKNDNTTCALLARIGSPGERKRPLQVADGTIVDKD